MIMGKCYTMSRFVYPKLIGWQVMNYERGGKMVCRYFWPTAGSEGG